MAQIAPSILSADFSRLAEEIRSVESAGAELVHLDVMDGHFVPNITIGPPIVKSIRQATSLPLDVHLMIDNPDVFVEAFVAAGADWISVHVETCPHLDRTLNLIKSHHLKAGVVLNPATPIVWLDECLGFVDYVLLMSVNPGYGGQEFIPYSLEKVRRLRKVIQERGLLVKIEVDGGIGLDNLAELVRSGADILVIGSQIFGAPDPAQAFRLLNERAIQCAPAGQR
jgi:ribulose-phosphate 3-epimerase